MQTYPNLLIERELWDQGYTVIGIDEVGRGAFAGPVYVSAVAFTPTKSLEKIEQLESLGINDSKKVSSTKRRILSTLLQKEDLLHSTASIDSAYINTDGIMAALSRAVLQVTQDLISQLPEKKPYILLDGKDNPFKESVEKYMYRNIIKGDSISLSIAASSIIAKVTRDQYMASLESEFPVYNWSKNKGYGTKEHIEAIKKYGHCHHHRLLYLRKIKSTLQSTK